METFLRPFDQILNIFLIFRLAGPNKVLTGTSTITPFPIQTFLSALSKYTLVFVSLGTTVTIGPPSRRFEVDRVLGIKRLAIFLFFN